MCEHDSALSTDRKFSLYGYRFKFLKQNMRSYTESEQCKKLIFDQLVTLLKTVNLSLSSRNCTLIREFKYLAIFLGAIVFCNGVCKRWRSNVSNSTRQKV